MQEILLNLEKFLAISPALGLLACFAAGFIVSFSPCIYPLIPITISVIGADSTDHKSKSFIASFIFVLGVAITYTSLGVFAAIAGKIFSVFFMNPWTYGLVSLVFILFGLVYMDLIKIRFSGVNLHYQYTGGLISLLVLGMVSGLTVIPCNFPVLGAILSLISVKGQILYGIAGLFLFSLGYGSLLLIIGISSSLLKKLPKQGVWLIIIKRLMGAILVVIGVIFVFKTLALLGI